MSKKYLCPKHREDTPSANAYADGYHCFGCGARGPLSELGIPAGERIEYVYQEDIVSSIRAIRNLPKAKIRGFLLHANEREYFLLWPNDTYFKRRIYGAEAGSKYRGPSGHSKPFFRAVERGGEALVLIEGEFNALSYALLENGSDVISPGGAGDFYSRNGSRELSEFATKYARIDIVVDSDAAGAQAAIETKAKLITLGCPEVRLHLVEKDFNDILVQDGKEALRDECKRLGLFDV